jgi:hypothetical protein
LSGNFVPPFP